MTVIRALYQTPPGAPHTEVRVFAAPAANQTFALLGKLTLRSDTEEAEHFLTMLENAGCELIEEQF